MFYRWLQFCSLPFPPSSSFFVFFFMHWPSQNFQLWSIIAQKQPQKDQRQFQPTLLLAASKHYHNKRHVSFINDMNFFYFFFPVIHMSIFCEILEFAGGGRSKTTWATKQQRIVSSEHWLCTWHVSDICADFIYFPWILIWRYWITQLRCMVCLYPQLHY